MFPPVPTGAHWSLALPSLPSVHPGTGPGRHGGPPAAPRVWCLSPWPIELAALAGAAPWVLLGSGPSERERYIVAKGELRRKMAMGEKRKRLQAARQSWQRCRYLDHFSSARFSCSSL